MNDRGPLERPRPPVLGVPLGWLSRKIILAGHWIRRKREERKIAAATAHRERDRDMA